MVVFLLFRPRRAALRWSGHLGVMPWCVVLAVL